MKKEMLIILDEASKLTQGSAGPYSELWYPVTCQEDVSPVDE